MVEYEKARAFAAKLARSYTVVDHTLIVVSDSIRAEFKIDIAPEEGIYHAKTGVRTGDAAEAASALGKGEKVHQIPFKALRETARFCSPAAAKLKGAGVRPEFSKLMLDGKTAYAVNGAQLHTCRYGTDRQNSVGFYLPDLNAFLAAFPASFDGDVVFTQESAFDALQCPDGSGIVSLMPHTDCLNYDRVIPREFAWEAHVSRDETLDLLKRYAKPGKGDKLAGFKGVAYRATLSPSQWKQVELAVERRDIVPECPVPYSGTIETGYVLPSSKGKDQIKLDADLLKTSLLVFDPLTQIDLRVSGEKQPIILAQGDKMAVVMPCY